MIAQVAKAKTPAAGGHPYFRAQAPFPSQTAARAHMMHACGIYIMCQGRASRVLTRVAAVFERCSDDVSNDTK